MADFLTQAMARSAERAADLPAGPTLARNPGAFRRALEAGPLLIAEIKRASPSKGPIRPDADAVALARAYAAGGAGAISVLTEPDWFGGSLHDLRAVRAAVDLPLLRKDFIADPRQLSEAADAGADAVLLIVAALDDARLHALLAEATTLGLDALVEVHDAPELARALDAGAGIIGVNNRNLASLSVGTAAVDLAALAPPGTLLVAESGLRAPKDIHRHAALGYRAFLVGEALMRADDTEAATRALVAALAYPGEGRDPGHSIVTSAADDEVAAALDPGLRQGTA